VASTYDDVRAGYPDEVLDEIRAYRGAPPASVADLGAGTGKATELLLRLGAPVTAIEPDPRMADVLRAKFPAVEVVGAAFEEWTPPELRQRTLDGLDELLGETVVLDLRTVLVLARRG